MSRSGYIDDGEHWHLIMWRGAVASAMRGKRGQAFLKEMLAALDALPTPALIEGELELNGDVCAIGAVGKARGIDMHGVDVENHERIANLFNIPNSLACEIMWWNDEAYSWRNETPEERFVRVRKWLIEHIKR